MRRQTFSLSFFDSIIVNIPTRESRHHIAYIELTLKKKPKPSCIEEGFGFSAGGK